MSTARGLVAIAALSLVAGCGGSGDWEFDNGLRDAYNQCWMRGSSLTALDLVDDGEALVISTAEDGSMPAVKCAIRNLGTADRVITQIDSTNALMGVRTATDGGYRYEWTYHPDNGLDLTVTNE